MGGLKFSIPVSFGYENFDLRGYFFAYSKQSEFVILHNVSDETEDVLVPLSFPVCSSRGDSPRFCGRFQQNNYSTRACWM